MPLLDDGRHRHSTSLVSGRAVGGTQQITDRFDFHTYTELVLQPFKEATVGRFWS